MGDILFSYIKFRKELNYPIKRLINIQNIDHSECFQWSIARHLNPTNHHPARITKADRHNGKTLHFKDMKCQN